MNIQQVKEHISQKAGFTLVSLSLSRQMAEESTPDNPVPTEWLTHWDNENRVRVVMHQDVMEKIKSDLTFNSLAVKPMEIVEKEGVKPYKKFVVITPNIEVTF